MVAKHIVLMQAVISRKADKGEWSRLGAVKTRFDDLKYGKVFYADQGIFLNSAHIVQNEWRMECIGINQKDQTHKEQQTQNRQNPQALGAIQASAGSLLVFLLL